MDVLAWKEIVIHSIWEDYILVKIFSVVIDICCQGSLGILLMNKGYGIGLALAFGIKWSDIYMLTQHIKKYNKL